MGLAYLFILLSVCYELFGRVIFNLPLGLTVIYFYAGFWQSYLFFL